MSAPPIPDKTNKKLWFIIPLKKHETKEEYREWM